MDKLIFFKNEKTNEVYQTKKQISSIKDNEKVKLIIHKNFDTFDWQKEPEDSFKEICKKRAEQIRSLYDYIVFYFSGGSDSITALNAFLKNDIPIDEIVIYTNSDTVNPKVNNYYAVNYLKLINYKGLVNIVDLNFKILSDICRKDKWNNMENFTGLLHSFSRFKIDFFEENDYLKTNKRHENLTHLFSGIFPKIVKENSEYFSIMSMNSFSYASLDPSHNQFFTSVEMPEIHIKQSHIIAKYLKDNSKTNRETSEVRSSDIKLLKLCIRDEYNEYISPSKNVGNVNQINFNNDSQSSIMFRLYSNETEFLNYYNDSILLEFKRRKKYSLEKKYLLFKD
jgi:hypothetical protein